MLLTQEKLNNMNRKKKNSHRLQTLKLEKKKRRKVNPTNNTCH